MSNTRLVPIICRLVIAVILLIAGLYYIRTGEWPLVLTVFDLVGTVSAEEPESVTVRINYLDMSIPLHLKKVFERTDILEKNNIRPEFLVSDTGKSSVGKIDIGLGRTIQLFCSGGFKGKIIANLGPVLRYALMVPSDSPIMTLSELKGKTIVAIESDDYLLVNALRQAKLNPAKDIKMVQINEVSASPEIVWSFGPTTDFFCHEKKYRIIFEIKDDALVSVSDEFSDAHPESVKSFINALKEAFFFMATHKEIVAGWVTGELSASAGSDFSPSQTLTLNQHLCELNPNYLIKSISEVEMGVSSSDITDLKRNARHQLKLNRIERLPDFDNLVSTKFSDEVKRKIDARKYDPASVKIKAATE